MPLGFRGVLNFRLVETSLDAADTSVCATSGSLSCGADSLVSCESGFLRTSVRYRR